MFAELPVEIEDPVLRLPAISDQMKDLKESKEALAGEALTSMSGFAPPMLLALGMRIATRPASAASTRSRRTSRDRSSPCTRRGVAWCGRSRTCRSAGQIRLAIAIFSYDGEVNFGITGDYDTTPDIDVLAHGIEDGMAQLLKD